MCMKNKKARVVFGTGTFCACDRPITIPDVIELGGWYHTCLCKRIYKVTPRISRSFWVKEVQSAEDLICGNPKWLSFG